MVCVKNNAICYYIHLYFKGIFMNKKQNYFQQDTSNNLVNKQHHALLTYLLLSIIICEGFVSVSVEILAMRQLIPFVGSSVIVTSLIIGIFLLFLAVGYWRGGTYKSDFYQTLRRNFIYGSIFIGIGLSYVFAEYFFAITYKLVPHILPILTLYLLLIIAPLIYFLGQTIPLTMNLVKQEVCTGATGGKVLFWSTVGSFFGSVLTSLLLMQYLGVALTVCVACSVLLLLVCLLQIMFNLNNKIINNKITDNNSTNLANLTNCTNCTICNHKNIHSIVVALVLLGIIYIINVGFEKQFFLKTNNYANYQVEHDVDFYHNNHLGKILKINNSYSSYIDDNNYGFSYIELIKKILFKGLKIQDKEILVVGAGGFTLSAESTFGNHFTYIDIDPEIRKVVKKDFLDDIKGDFIAQDARVFFNHNKKSYDVIVSDVYSNTATIPAELLTVEYFTKVKQALKPNGIAVFNIIAHPLFSDAYSKRINNTLNSVFKNCGIMPLMYDAENLSNIIYVCHVSDNENDTTVYRDNRNTVNTDMWLGKKNM